MTISARQPIFVHSLWRAGSTYIFNTFRRSGYWAYQEPVHEIAMIAKDNPDILSGFTSEALAPLRHPQLEKPYFYELQQTHQVWQAIVEKRIIYDDYFGVTPIDPLQHYYQALIDASPARPVMQDCRTASRIGVIKQALDGTHIYLWRNPWDQWWSFKINNYFDAAIQIILGAHPVPDVVRRLRHETGYVEFHHDDIGKEFEHFGQRHPDSETSYLCFYTLWCLGLLEGISQADQLLNIDALSNDEKYREQIIQQINELNISGLEFTDCHVPQAYYNTQEIEFFTRIENRVHGLLLISGYSQTALDALRDMRQQYQPTRAIEPHNLTRDLQRAREIALRHESAEANFMRHHHQAINEVMQQSRQLQQDLAHNQQQCEQETSAQLLALQQQAAAKKIQIDAEYQIRLQTLQQQHTKQEQTHQQRITELNQNLQLMQAQAIARETEHSNQQQQLQRELLLLQQQYTERERETAAQLLALQQQLQTIQTSHIWRWTAPLRAVAQWFNGGGNPDLTKKGLGSVLQVTVNLPSGANHAQPSSQAETQKTDIAATQPDQIIDTVSNVNIFIKNNSKDQIMPEIQNIYQLLELNSEEFVIAAYQILLGRAVDPEGLQYYLKRLSQGYGKETVIDQIMRSSEAFDRKTNIPSMNKFLQETRKKHHWFFGKWGRAKRLEMQIHRLEHEMGRMIGASKKRQEDILARIKTIEIQLSPEADSNSQREIGHIPKLDINYINAIKPIKRLTQVSSSPKFSVIVLQFNKSDLTINCVRSLLRYTDLEETEIIVVDNGSFYEHIKNIKTEFGISIKIVEIGINRYFGEGNNIGVDHSSGEYIIFMNNDIAVTAGWLEEFKKHLKNDTDILGPTFLYPDGRVQECGAYIRKDGTTIQQFKGEHINNLPKVMFECDYISAATILLKKETFLKVGGFDLCYEPAYYEDVDLCLKVATYGGKVLCIPTVHIFHNENATSSDITLGLNLSSNIVENNRQKFNGRWGGYLSERIKNSINKQMVIGSACTPVNVKKLELKNHIKPKALLYSPYPLTPGGGEKYLLTIAQELSNDYYTTLSFPYLYSESRLRQLEKYLNLNLLGVNLNTFSEIKDQEWDIAFVLGNSIAPPFHKPAPTSFYICQFPFDQNLYVDKKPLYYDEYQYVCYSDFVKNNILNNKYIQPSKITVLSPVIQNYSVHTKKEKIIISVGRFFTGGHCKNQHLLIEAFRKLIKQNYFVDWKMILIGSTRPEYDHRMYYKRCIDDAQDLNIEIVPDASFEVLSEAYAKASVYWHGSGLTIDIFKHPEQLEHFGITPLEAASAGCEVFVPNSGGPGEIAKKAPGRFHVYSSIDELVDKTVTVCTHLKFTGSQLESEISDFVDSFNLNTFNKKLSNLVQSVKLNDHYKLGDQINADEWKVKWVGWDEPEDHFRWSIKHKSRIDFLWGDDNKNTFVKIKFKTLDAQKIHIKLNEDVLFDDLISGEDIILELKDINLMAGLNSFIFSFPTAHQPGNGDSRLLACAFQTLKFSAT